MIIESSSTFTGKPKELTFKNNRHLFKFAEDKIKYKSLDLPPLDGRDPFVLERLQRAAMDDFLPTIAKSGDRIIMADVDEIPNYHTIFLVKNCDTPNLHLQLRNYIYSFEFPVDFTSWRAKVVIYPYPYGHSRTPSKLLADCGWHCSFCFPTLEDFKFKMQAYSHSDRVHSNDILSSERIQKVICEGSDIYDLVPEAYTFKELYLKLTPEKSKSAVALPRLVLKEPKRFSYLLPGGCKRVDSSPAYEPKIDVPPFI
jgi:beta-1,4-mannosyl-glycoprotein beta-1,4-N-acetylglucosaminyltransferase